MSNIIRQELAREKRATPGGYGGKPPGVAIIGVPTGARNAGSGASTGDRSTDMNNTRSALGACQDLNRSESRNAIPVPRLRVRLLTAHEQEHCVLIDVVTRLTSGKQKSQRVPAGGSRRARRLTRLPMEARLLLRTHPS